MKIKNRSLLITGTLLAWGLCGSLAAQTCSSPQTISANQTINNANNCGAADPAPGPGTGDTSLGSVCDNTTATGGVHIYTWTGSASGSGNITVTPTAPYNAAVAIGSGTDCSAAAGGFCDVAAVDGAAQAAESIAIPNSAGKKYFLFVFSTASGTARCGSYNMAVGNLPVTLQKFTIE